MHIGIDLGTTFCCVSYIDDEGKAQIIKNSDGKTTTPSVICFDGKVARVGEKAIIMKAVGMPHLIKEFVKRDIGKPIEIPPNLYESEDQHIPEAAPYEVNGFKYGAAGMSAIILRKLKKEAVKHFQKIGKIDSSVDEKNILLDAVITVPAYFGDMQRQDTQLAGFAAGLNVISIINEPTAAALTYGLQNTNKKIMVFDLGGGTFDISILEMKNGNAVVVATDGHNTLGGKDWDHIIQTYIYDKFREKNGSDIPDDRIFEVQSIALNAKLALTENDETEISIDCGDVGNLNIKLFREAPTEEAFAMVDSLPFYFNDRSQELLNRCRVILLNTLEKAGLNWDDIDEILLAGGSCRMPMIIELVEKLSGRKIKRNFIDYDTAIASGAALYGLSSTRDLVKDVVSKTVGIKVMQNERFFIEHLILEGTQLPCKVEKIYKAGDNAILEVYEGSSIRPDECIMRGRLELDNGPGEVKIILSFDKNGVLKAVADYMPVGKKEIEFKSELYNYVQRAMPLKDKIQSINYYM